MFTIPKSSAFVWVVDHQTWGGLWLFELEPHHILRKKMFTVHGIPWSWNFQRKPQREETWLVVWNMEF